MKAFGQSLEQKTITTVLFRKVNGENAFRGGDLCFSTEGSKTLISQGEFCLVLKKSEYTGLYTDGDADAGKNYGYDEFRVSFSRDELIEAIDYIVVPESWSETDEGQDWMDNLSDYGFVVTESSFRNFEPEIVVDFNF